MRISLLGKVASRPTHISACRVIVVHNLFYLKLIVDVPRYILEKVSTEVMLNLCFHLFPVQSYEKK